jgi:hypothetical protein
MSLEKAGKYAFEVGMYRPPSEGGSYSLLLRFTRNCPWNKCTFCGMYKHEKFSLRTSEEIKGDIDSIAELIKDMQSLSWELGYDGQINRDVIIGMIEKEPELNTSQGFVMILNWMSSGGKTAFLQDGNSLMMPSDNWWMCSSIFAAPSHQWNGAPPMPVQRPYRENPRRN